MAKLSSFKRRIRSGYALSFLLMLVSYSLIFYVQQRLSKEAGWVIHSYTIVNNTQSLKSEVTDAETGMRGYVITHDARFLKPYNDAVIQIPGLIQELERLTADNPEQQRRIDTLNQLVDLKLEILTSGLKQFQTSGFVITDSMKGKRETSLNTMDSMRMYVSRVAAEEQKLMDTRKARLSDLFSSANIMGILSLSIVFFALLYSVITFNRENKAREKADKRALRYRIDLESNKHELQERNVELNELKSMEKFTSTGRIARTIAHEVRNPLTNILLATDQLNETANGNEESSVLLELIKRNATRINQLVSDLLNATRFSHLNFAKTNINQLLDETLEMAKDRFELSGVMVEKNYSDEICEIHVDKEKLKIALLNIIVNAVEAMEKGMGMLQLKVRKQGNKCIIEIRDNGKGMDDEVLQNLFEPYFTSKLKGNGLGLTNTQNIILNHRGKISVYSKPGKGALFVVALDLSLNSEGIEEDREEWRGKIST
jgi:signal transduction histidine kinase